MFTFFACSNGGEYIPYVEVLGILWLRLFTSIYRESSAIKKYVEVIRSEDEIMQQRIQTIKSKHSLSTVLRHSFLTAENGFVKP